MLYYNNEIYSFKIHENNFLVLFFHDQMKLLTASLNEKYFFYKKNNYEPDNKIFLLL